MDPTGPACWAGTDDRRSVPTWSCGIHLEIPSHLSVGAKGISRQQTTMSVRLLPKTHQSNPVVNGTAQLSLQPRRPVEHDRDLFGAFIGGRLCEEELLAVAGNAVLIDIRILYPRRRLKQNSRRSGLECCASFHLGRHQLSTEREIKEFLAVLSPEWLATTAERYLPLFAECGECSDVNLPPARFVRAVRHPVLIRRHSRRLFVELRCQQRRRFLFAGKWQLIDSLAR